MAKDKPFNPLESPTGERPNLTINLNEGVDEQVSIIIVHRDSPEFLNICVQSIHIMSNLNNYEVIVVDNGSSHEDTQEYLNVLEEQGIKVVRNDKNYYWSKAANQGVAVADPNSKYFIFLHSDTVILNAAWIDVLINICSARNAGIVGTDLQHYYIQKKQVGFVPEWCMLMTRQCWEDCGPWNEELPLVGMSFIMTYRAQLKGYSPQSSGNAIVHHYKAFNMDPNEYERMCEDAMGKIGRLMHQIQGS